MRACVQGLSHRWKRWLSRQYFGVSEGERVWGKVAAVDACRGRLRSWPWCLGDESVLVYVVGGSRHWYCVGMCSVFLFSKGLWCLWCGAQMPVPGKAPFFDKTTMPWAREM